MTGRILVTGASGYVGRALSARLGRVLALYNQVPVPGGVRFDALTMRLRDVVREPAGLSHGVILHAMANPDACAAAPELSWAINVDSAIAAIDDLVAWGAKPVFVSSEAVFGGDEARAYGEDDVPAPRFTYGRQKRAVERHLEGLDADHAIVRLARVVGAGAGDTTGFGGWLDAIAAGRPVRCAADQTIAPIAVEDAAEGLAGIVEHDLSGLYHLAGPGPINRLDLLMLLIEAVRAYRPVEVAVERARLRDFAAPEPRPLTSALDIGKLAAATGFSPRDYRSLCCGLAAAAGPRAGAPRGPGMTATEMHVGAAGQEAAALDRAAAGYDFEDGAVLVQIPQVPPALIESHIARNRGYFAYPPQGLLYLAAAFRELGIASAIVDLNYEVLRAAQEDASAPERAWQGALDRALARFDRPFVCVSYMFDPTYPQLTDTCRYIKRTRPELALAVGGVAATPEADRILAECGADFVFANEGEPPLQQFYAYLRGESPRLPANLSFRAAEGTVVRTPLTTGGDVDLDIRDQYSKLGIERYFTIGSLNNFSRMRGTDVPFATVLSRRGCRARCTFCAVRNFNGKSVRTREVDGVVDEMVYLWDSHGIRHFEWLDDDLLYDRDAALRMFQEIARRLPDATWCANNGLIAAAVTPELLEAMQASGCQGFTVGLESGNEAMLRLIRKPATLKRFRLFAHLSRGYPKIFYIVNFILGLPEERFEQMLDSFALSVDAALDWNNFFTYQPLKNTDAYLAYGGLDDSAGAEELVKRGTTINYNPVRGGAFKTVREDDGIATAYDVLDLDPTLVPGAEQGKEIWFTFNTVANFLRLPALFTEQEERVRNAIGWLGALETAYPDNPLITCLLYYLNWRLGEMGADALEALRGRATAKLDRLPYWRHRDAEFQFTAFLDRAIPPLEPRAERFFANRGIRLAAA